MKRFPNRSIQKIKTPDKYTLQIDSPFADIKAYAEAHLKASFYANQYLDAKNREYLNSDRGYNQKKIDQILQDYNEFVIGQVQQDFKLHRILHAESNGKEEVLKAWASETYYYLFNDFSSSDVEKVINIAALYFCCDLTTHEDDAKKLYENHKDIFDKKKQLFVDQVYTLNNDIKLDFNTSWDEQITISNAPVILNHIKRIFLERKHIFTTVLEGNLIAIDGFLKELVEEGDKLKPRYYRYQFKDALDSYIDALNYSCDFIFFKKPERPDLQKHSGNEQLEDDPKEKTIDDLFKKIAKLEENFKNLNIQDSIDKINEINKAIVPTETEKEKNYFQEYFQKGKWSTLKDDEKEEFISKNLANICSVVTGDLGAALGDILTSGDAKGAGEKILSDLPVSYTHLTLPTILLV